MKKATLLSFALFLSVIFITGCAQQKRLGMVTDPDSGLQFGSVAEKSFFIDSSQLINKNVKITARNISGDTSYNIQHFVQVLEETIKNKGYTPSKNDNFGMKYDVIIEYSGHVQNNMSGQYAFLGGAAGGIAGYRSSASASEAIGILSGATLGAIAGSYITDDTYIIIARVTVGLSNNDISDKKSVVFSSSPKLQESNDSRINYFDQILSTRIAVFAGGRNVKQSEIVNGVKSRLLSIISDII